MGRFLTSGTVRMMPLKPLFYPRSGFFKGKQQKGDKRNRCTKRARTHLSAPFGKTILFVNIKQVSGNFNPHLGQSSF